MPWYSDPVEIVISNLAGFVLADGSPYYKLQDASDVDLTECTLWSYKISIVVMDQDSEVETRPGIILELDANEPSEDPYHSLFISKCSDNVVDADIDC